MWYDGIFIKMYNTHLDPHLRSPFPKKVWEVLSEYFSSIDPNWAGADIDFDHSGQPISASLNGPKHGTISFLEKFNEFFTGVLASDMENYFSPIREYIKSWGLNFDFHNPDHKLELLDGRTEIVFENCEIGTVRNYNPQNQTFEVCQRRYIGYRDEINPDSTDRYKMNIRELLWELAMDEESCQAVDIWYLPPTA